MKDLVNFQFEKTLEGDEMGALQIAAILGNTFSVDHVFEIAGIKPSNFLMLIRKMVARGFLREKSGSAEGDYSFAEKGIRNALLKSVGKEKRIQQIFKIITYLERELPNDENKSLRLACLYLELGSEEEGFQYIKKAADLLSSAHKTIEALNLYREIIERLLSKERDSLEDTLLMNSVISYVPIAINRCSSESIHPLLKESISISRNLRNKWANSMLEICMGRLLQSLAKTTEADFHFQEGWRIAKSVGDKGLLKAVSKNYALSLFWLGRISEAIRTYERTLGNLEEISRDLRDLWAYLMLAYCYGIQGRVSRGVGLAEAVRERAVSLGYLGAQSFSHAVIAHILLEARRMKDAEFHINRALEIGEKIDSNLALWMAKPCKAYERYSKGDLKGAKALLESAISHAKSMGQAYSPSPLIVEMLWALDCAKFEPIEGYSFALEVTRLTEWSNLYMKGAGLRFLALSKKGSAAGPKEIEKLLEESRRLLTEAGAKVERARTEIELTRLYLESSDNAKAKKLAGVAYRTLSEVDDHLFPSELLFLIKKLPRSTRVDDGISRLNKILISLSANDEFLGEVITIITDMFGAERGVIFTKEGENSHAPLRIVASRNFSPEELRQLDNGTLREFVNSAIHRKELVISLFPKGKALAHEAESSLHHASMVCIPLKAGNNLHGLAYMDNRLLKGLFSKRDMSLMCSIGMQVGLAIELSGLRRRTEMDQSPVQEETIYAPKPGGSDANDDFEIVGESEGMRKVVAQVAKVAGTGASVLISGETGVGKELIARNIYSLSGRASGPFISVNISALPQGLIISELFGHEKGAFTGAIRSKPGRFEMANNGTIFLDEIGDLSMEAQVDLLRVLEEGEFYRVGGTKPIRSNFRLIAATNRDLHEEILNGKFRLDLYYRLSSFPIEVPPLREREKDILPLALYFMRQYTTKYEKKVKRISRSEIPKLLEYQWPGNVRELKHVIERAVILSESENLVLPSLEARPVNKKEDLQHPNRLVPLSEIEKGHILSVLENVKWRVRGEKGAAKILGLKPSTLEYRMKKLGIARNGFSVPRAKTLS